MDPTVPTAAVPPHGALFYVAAVNLVIWAGLFAYLFYLDRRIRAATKKQTPEDPR
jgi:CcmD family protein